MFHTWYLFLTKYIIYIFFSIFWYFFQPFPSTQTFQVIGLIFFFNELALKNWAINMHFNPMHKNKGFF